MADLQFQQSQRQVQRQSQILSQKQIQVLNLIAMNSLELRDEIYKAVDENPALEIVDDPFLQGINKVKNSRADRRIDLVHTGKTSARGVEASDNFQKLLESSPDERETLKEHLLGQLRVSRLKPEEKELCEKLIENLDQNGFHFLAPESLLEKSNPLHTDSFLKNCISIVQKFDPVGTCVKNLEEGLLVQAEQKSDCPPLAEFILKGHLELISPPDPEKALKKLLAFVKEQEKMAFLREDEILKKELLTPENVKEAISFIKTLNPFPASAFDTKQTIFIQSDFVVTTENGFLEKDDFEAGLVKGSTSDLENAAPFYFRVRLLKDAMPKVTIAPSFAAVDEKNTDSTRTGDASSQNADFMSYKRNATDFLESIEFRDKAVLKTFSTLVSLQKDFFAFGPEKLKPLTRKHLSEITGVHESTISRFASSKYVRTAWGTFPLSYFFSSWGSTTTSTAENTSSTVIKLEIKKILEEHKNDNKKLSDQKIADILEERGIKIARRTVAKYRDSLNISSSYDR